MSLSAIVRKSLTPLIYVNFAAMIAAGGWLAAQGFISVIWPSIVALLFSPLILPLFLFPTAFFAGMMQVTTVAYPRVSKVMAVLSGGYLVVAFAVYVIGTFYMVSFVMGREALAAAVFGVSAALTPFAVLAAKDPGNLFFTGLVWMAEVTAVLVMALGLKLLLGLWDSFWLFAAVMGIMVLLQALYERLFLKQPAAVTPPAVAP